MCVSTIDGAAVQQAGMHGSWATQSYSSLLALGPRAALVTYAAAVPSLHPGQKVLSFDDNSTGFSMRIDFKGASTVKVDDPDAIQVRAGSRHQLLMTAVFRATRW